MKSSYLKSNKAFSLVELLATITILGILSTVAIISVSKLLQKAKDNHYKAQRDNMALAAQSYLNDNRNKLPKNIGQSSKVPLEDLQNKNYIKEVFDYNKNACSKEDSYVKVFKYSKTKYSYAAYLDCPNHKTNASNNSNFSKPDIEIKSIDDDRKVQITIEGKPNKIISYSYIISKEFKTGDKKKYIEIINSGVKKANIKDTVVEKVDISKHLPAKLKIVVTATDIYGNVATKTKTDNVKDEILPICESVEGQSTTWSKGERTITVNCKDEESGCENLVYSKTFKNDAKTEVITIKDKSGNETKCKVNVYIDNTPPVITSLKSPNEKVWTNKSFQVDIEAKDEYSGIEEYKYFYDSNQERSVYDLTSCAADKTCTISKDKSSFKTTAFSKERNEYAYIEVCDKVGNCINKKTKVQIDKTKPTITLTAYKSLPKQTGPTGDPVQTLNSGSKLNQYNNTVNGWLNISNYPDGVYYKATYKDSSSVANAASGLKEELWRWNIVQLTEKKFQETISDTAKMYPDANKRLTAKTGLESSGAFALSGNGVRSGIISITDQAGNKASVTVEAKIDTVVPTITITNPKEAVWTNQNFQVNVTSTDSLSMIDGYKYYYDSNTTRTAYDLGKCNLADKACTVSSDKSQFTTTAFSKERNEYAYIEVCDKAGNCSNKKTKVQIDKTKPTIILTAYKSLPKQAGPTGDIVQTLSGEGKLNQYNNTVNGWLNKTNYPDGVYYKATYKDSSSVANAASGLKEELWRWNIGQLTEKKFQETISNTATMYPDANKRLTAKTGLEGSGAFALSGNGVRAGIISITDQAGNKASVTVEAKIDTVSPTNPELTTTHTLQTNASYPKAQIYSNGTWINKNVYMCDAREGVAPYIGPSSTEAISGIDHYEISEDNKNWTKYAYNGALPLYQVQTEGTNYRYFRAIDKAGNVSGILTKTIKIDKTAPTNTTSVVSSATGSTVNRINNDNYTNQKLIWGNFSATENLSGIAYHQYSTGCTGNPNNKLSSSYNYPLNGATTMNSTFCIRTIDNAGNVGAWSSPYIFKIDLNKTIELVDASKLIIDKSKGAATVKVKINQAMNANNITWKINNSNYATIVGNGTSANIKGIKNTGDKNDLYVEATLNGTTVKRQIEVITSPTAITISGNNLDKMTLANPENLKDKANHLALRSFTDLTATIQPADANVYTGITWSSNNSSLKLSKTTGSKITVTGVVAGLDPNSTTNSNVSGTITATLGNGIKSTKAINSVQPKILAKTGFADYLTPEGFTTLYLKNKTYYAFAKVTGNDADGTGKHVLAILDPNNNLNKVISIAPEWGHMNGVAWNPITQEIWWTKTSDAQAPANLGIIKVGINNNGKLEFVGKAGNLGLPTEIPKVKDKDLNLAISPEKYTDTKGQYVYIAISYHEPDKQKLFLYKWYNTKTSQFSLVKIVELKPPKYNSNDEYVSQDISISNKHLYIVNNYLPDGGASEKKDRFNVFDNYLLENLIQGKVNYEKRLIISYDKFYLGSEYENGTEINAEVEGIDYDQNKNRFIILVNKKGGANDSLFTFDASLLK